MSARGLSRAEASSGSGSAPSPRVRPAALGASAWLHAFIRKGVEQGLSAQRIWQDLVEQYGYPHRYLIVQR